jgi:hypothetical protein
MNQSVIDIIRARSLWNMEDGKWTEWIQSIKDAKDVKLYLVQNENENWLDDDTCIQNKRMTVNDLPKVEKALTKVNTRMTRQWM